jgi:predicted MFS family arabinose efflux permease
VRPAGQEARRTAIILSATHAIVGSAAFISVSLGALAGQDLLGTDKSLATAPVTGFNLGVALGALPAASIIRALGRRNGFIAGCLVTALGGAAATAGLYAASFWLFGFGLLLVGVGNAFVQQYRFAAADSAPPGFKARAISLVLAGGIVTAVIGPQVVIFTRDLLAPVMFAGAFVGVILLGLAGMAILFWLKRPAEGTSATGGAFSHATLAGTARPLSEIVMQPRFIVALICAVCAFTLMTFVMTGAPLAMVGCGFSPDEATLGISWHVMAMFGPSFFTGRLIARFGKERIVTLGLVLLVGCAAVALSGIHLWQFWTALILLGLGWNFGFIGATAMVADSYAESEKSKVQGFHDLMLFGSVALSSLLSGAVYNAWGWAMLNWIIFPVVLVCFAALGMLALSTRRVAA